MLGWTSSTLPMWKKKLKCLHMQFARGRRKKRKKKKVLPPLAPLANQSLTRTKYIIVQSQV